jgi:hypothetical protein
MRNLHDLALRWKPPACGQSLSSLSSSSSTSHSSLVSSILADERLHASKATLILLAQFGGSKRLGVFVAHDNSDLLLGGASTTIGGNARTVPATDATSKTFEVAGFCMYELGRFCADVLAAKLVTVWPLLASATAASASTATATDSSAPSLVLHWCSPLFKTLLDSAFTLRETQSVARARQVLDGVQRRLRNAPMNDVDLIAIAQQVVERFGDDISTRATTKDEEVDRRVPLSTETYHDRNVKLLHHWMIYVRLSVYDHDSNNKDE